jgi:hypothetical protein
MNLGYVSVHFFLSSIETMETTMEDASEEPVVAEEPDNI